MLSTTGGLSMPARASSGVDVVTTGLRTGVDSAASSEGAGGLASEGVPELHQVHGAYQDPLWTEDAIRRTLEAEHVPVRQFADCSALARHDGADPAILRGTEENCHKIESARDQLD